MSECRSDEVYGFCELCTHFDPDWTGFCIYCGEEHALWPKTMCCGSSIMRGEIEMKKVVAEVTVRVAYEVPDDYDEEQIKFHIEEHLCGGDLLAQAQKEDNDANDKSSCTCYRMKAKYIGEYSGPDSLRLS